jgi:hypothetical protein
MTTITSFWAGTAFARDPTAYQSFPTGCGCMADTHGNRVITAPEAISQITTSPSPPCESKLHQPQMRMVIVVLSYYPSVKG